MQDEIITFDPVAATHMPLSERVLDKLGDILLASDDILDMIATSPVLVSEDARSIERSIRGVYDQVNDLMKQIAD